MTKMKKTLAFALAVLMMLSLCPASVFAAEGDTEIVIEEQQPVPEGNQLLATAEQDQMVLQEAAPIQYVFNDSTSFYQNDLYSKINSLFDISGSATVYLAAGGKQSVNKDTSSAGFLNANLRTLTDGATYTVYASDKTTVLGTFVFYLLKVKLQKNKTVSTADLSSKAVLEAVLDDSMQDVLAIVNGELTVTYQSKNKTYQSLDYKTPGSGEHIFGTQNSETVKVTLKKGSDSVEATATVNITNPSEIRYASGAPVTVEVTQGDDYAAKMREALIVTDKAGNPITGSSAISFDNLELAIGPNTVKATYAGGTGSDGKMYESAELADISVTLKEAPHSTVSIVRTGTDNKGVLTVNDRVVSDGDSLMSIVGQPLVVKVTPDTNGYVKSLSLTDGNGQEVTPFPVEGDTYTFTGLVENAAYTLSVTMNEITVAVKGGSVTILDTVTEDTLEQALIEAVVDEAGSTLPAAIGTDGVTVTVEYKAGSQNTSFISLGTAPGKNQHAYKLGTENIGKNETVHVTYAYDGKTATSSNVTVTVVDHRTATAIVLDPSVQNDTVVLANPGERVVGNEARKAAYIAQVLAVLTLQDAQGNPLSKDKLDLSAVESLFANGTTASVWGTSPRVEVKYAGDETYQPATKTVTLSFDDPRKESSLKFYANARFAYNETTFDGLSEDAVKALVFDAIVEDCEPQMLKDGKLISGVDIKYNASKLSDSDWKDLTYQPASYNVLEHKFGKWEAENIRITFTGNEEYKPLPDDIIIKNVPTVDDRTDTTLVFNSDPEYRYNGYEGMPLDTRKLEQAIIDAVVNKDASTDNVKIASGDLTVEYLAYEGITSLTDRWKNLDSTDTTLGAHKFGDEAIETVRLRFTGNEEYKPMSSAKSVKVKLTDTRTPIVITTQDTITYPYYSGKHELMTAEEIDQTAYKGIVKSSSPLSLTNPDGSLIYGAKLEYFCGAAYAEMESDLASLITSSFWKPLDNSNINATEHAFGENSTEHVRISYVGDATYQSVSSIFEVHITDPRTVPTLTPKTLEEGEHYVYSYYDGKKNIFAEDIFDIIVASTTPGMVNPDGSLSDEVTVEYYALNSESSLINLFTDGWEELGYTAQTGSGHNFGEKSVESIRISYAGTGENYHKYQETSFGPFDLYLEDLRTPTTIVKNDESLGLEETPYQMYVGSDIDAALSALLHVVDENGQTVPASKFVFIPPTETLEASEDAQPITVQYNGDDDYKPAEEIEVWILVSVPKDIYHVTLNVVNEVEGHNGVVSLIPSYHVAEEAGNVYRVEGHNGFTVVANPDKSTSRYNKYTDYTASIVVENEENGETVSSEERVDRLELSFDNELFAKTTNEDNETVIDGNYTVTVTFKTVDLALKSVPQAPYHKIRLEDGAYNPAFTDMLFKAIYDSKASTPGNLTVDDVKIEYHAGSTSLTWEPLDYKQYDIDILNLTHEFGARGVDSKEEVRVSYTVGGNTFTETTTVTLADLREETVMTCEAVSAMYNKLRDAIISKVKVNGAVTGDKVSFTPEQIAISDVDANLLQVQKVTVEYLGNSDYKPSSCEIDVYVLYGIATLNVSTKFMQYDPERKLADANAVLAGMIKVSPADLDYLAVINGMEPDLTSFVSLSFPRSLQERMKFDLLDNALINKFLPEGVSLDMVRELMGDLAVIDFYKLLSDGIGEGIHIKNLSGVLADITSRMNTEIPLINKTIAEMINIDTTAFDQLLSVLNALPLISDATITLGNAPRNAGAYTVTAISTDRNYLPTMGFGLLTITPLSKNVKLAFKETKELTQATTSLLKIPVLGTYEIPYEAFRSERFEEVCGAVLTYNGAIMDEELTITYTGLTDALDPVILDSNGKPTRSGTYIQTISASGNYLVLPVTRTIRVLPADVVIEAENLTVTYDGKAHAINAKVYFKEEGNPTVAPEDVTITYKQKTTSLLSGLKNLVTGATTTAPKEVGTYEVTISYNGASAQKKTVTLTIQEAPKAETTAKTTTTKTTAKGLLGGLFK